MSNSKTRLYHTYADEPPFECSTGGMEGDGLEVIIDKSTHELVVPKERETEETVTVIVRPKGGTPLVEEPAKGGAIGAGRARVERDIAESARRGLELFRRRRRSQALYALTLHPDGSGTLTVFDGGEIASAELSDPMIEQLIERLRSRARVDPS